MWTLDVIQESFEDVSLDYNSKKSSHRIYGGIHRQNSVNSMSRSLNSLATSNYSTTSLPNNSSRELLLTPSQKLKMIKKQRIQRSADDLANNTPEKLISIDFLADDVLPDDLIVFDIPSLHSLNSISNIKGRKPSLRRKNTVSSNSSNESATITNTHNISQQIENGKSTPTSQGPTPIFHNQFSSSSGMSSPATKASSIFSKSSDVSDYRYSQDDMMNPLSPDVKLINHNRDVKLEETLQRMSILKNLSQVDSNQQNHKYLSTTRQINLPPKTHSETLKHEREYQILVEKEISHEKEKLKKYQQKKRMIRQRNLKDEKLWDQVMENYDKLINLPQTRELWWRYVSSTHRKSIWKKQIISEKKVSFENSVILDSLRHSGDELEIACNYKSLSEEILKRKLESEDPLLLEKVHKIETFSDQIQFAFPEIGYFQIGETFDSVLKILLSFERLKSENEKLQMIDTIKLVNLVAVLFYVLDDEVDTIKCLISLVMKKLPHSMLTASEKDIPDSLSEDLKMEEKSQLTYLKDIKDQFNKYLLQVNPNLFNHLIVQDINTLRIVQGIASYLFSNQLPFDAVIRVLDIYAFEGDIILLRSSLAFLKKISYKLFGDKDDIFKVLNFTEVREPVDVGEVDEFVADIRNILKKKS